MRGLLVNLDNNEKPNSTITEEEEQLFELNSGLKRNQIVPACNNRRTRGVIIVIGDFAFAFFHTKPSEIFQ